MIQKKALVNIKILLTIVAFATTNWLSCMEPQPGSEALFLHAASAGTDDDVERILRETSNLCSQVLFAQSATTHDQGLQTHDDALQLAISGSQKLNTARYLAKMSKIVKAMLACDTTRGLKVIDAAVIRLLLIPNARNSFTREWEARQFLIQVLYDRLCELKQQTAKKLSGIDAEIQYHQERCAKHPDIVKFHEEKQTIESQRQEYVAQARRNYAVINEILYHAQWGNREDKERREDEFDTLTHIPSHNPILVALGYVNNPMGYLTAASIICVGVLLSRSSHK